MALDGFFRSRKVDKFVNRQPNPSEAREALLNFYHSAPVMKDVRAGERFVIIDQPLLDIYNAADVIWIYLRRTHPNVTYRIDFIIRTGETNYVTCKNEAEANELLQFLFPKLPGTAFGFHKELSSLWSSRDADKFDRFRAYARDQHAALQRGSGAASFASAYAAEQSPAQTQTVPAQPRPAPVQATAPAGTGVSVILQDAGTETINVIRLLRATLPDLSLREANEIVRSTPLTLRTGISRAEAEQVAAPFRAVGATILIQ